MIHAVDYNRLLWSKSCYNVQNVRWSGGVIDSVNHRTPASWIESMKPAVVGVSLGAGGVDSGMVLEKALTIWECSGRRCLQNEEWPQEWLSDTRENDLREWLIVCIRATLMRRDTCRDPDVAKNLTTTDVSSAFSFSEYLERVGEQTGLSTDLKSRGILCSLSFFESWSQRRQLAN